MPDNQLKQRVRWDVYLLILRAVAMFIMAAHGRAFIRVRFMALLLSYFEIWPERVLGAVFADQSRLYEYDADDPKLQLRDEQGRQSFRLTYAALSLGYS